MTAVGTKNYLDHAFVKGMSVEHAEVFSSKGSDHQPMVLDLDLK
jgi:endonuclease/exonuclease/phosphatase (EEP) superfamily protein YafD